MIRLAFVSLVSIFLIACDKNRGTSDLRRFTQNAYKDHVPQVEPLPPLRPAAVFIYTASGETDPFNRGNLRIQSTQENTDASGGEAGPDLTRRKEPLEAFPIDALNLVGIMTQNGIDWAIVNAPDKTVHRVTQGNYMGKNHGVITRVSSNIIEVKELVRNPIGRWENKAATLKLLE